MRLEHHLVGGYVRYISPYIIMLVVEPRYLTHYSLHTLKINNEASKQQITTVLFCELGDGIGNLKIQFKGVPSLISAEFKPYFICWYDSVVPCETTIQLKS